MTAQLDLLADTPRARNRDPRTSHQAAARIKASGQLGKQQLAVLELVQRYPGCTSAELAMYHALDAGQPAGDWRIYRPMVARRLPELAPMHVRKGIEPRDCTLNGTPAVTWWPR